MVLQGYQRQLGDKLPNLQWQLAGRCFGGRKPELGHEIQASNLPEELPVFYTPQFLVPVSRWPGAFVATGDTARWTSLKTGR